MASKLVEPEDSTLIGAMIILSARRTWITLRKLRSIQATPVLAQTMIMALIGGIDVSESNPPVGEQRMKVK